MNLQKIKAEAAAQMQCIEGTVRYITDKGRIRKEVPGKWEKTVCKLYVKNGKLHEEPTRMVEKSNKLADKPKQEKAEAAPKFKSS